VTYTVKPENAGRNAEIVARYRRGESYGDIARALNVSRNVVAGVIDRTVRPRAHGSNGSRRIDMTGRKFGRLTVVAESGRASEGSLVWKCTCECGSSVNVIGYLLRRGETRSCGCLRSETAREWNLRMYRRSRFGSAA
jgi:hypothetical protein